MQTAVVTRAPSDYRLLSERIRAAALLERRPWNYAARIGLTLAAFAGGWLALFVVGDSWAALGLAPFLAVLSTQVLFLGHDAGHQQIFGSRRANYLAGLVTGNLISGLSVGWWIPKHNAHHTYPNQIGRDPDIGPGAMPPAPCCDAVRPGPRAKYLYSAWHIARAVPLVLLELGMHLSSGRALARRRDRAAIVEWVLIGVNAGLFLTAIFVVLSPLRAIAFLVIEQALFGVYLRLSFAPNHKGMPIIEHDAKLEFMYRQVVTSRNVTGGWPITFLLGGLNYQIEHHLFPTMPRPNLYRAQRIVREFCLAQGLDYREDSLLGSYRQAIHFLRGGGTEPAAVGTP